MSCACAIRGEVPADMASLVSLPGVGRKLPRMVLGNAFGVPALWTRM